MVTKNMAIWDTAKLDALTRAKKVKKNEKKAKRQSVLDGPLSFMKLILLVMTVYALVQYVPAFVNFKKIIVQTTAQSSAQSGAQNLTLERQKWGLAAPLREYVKMNKAYMRAGQILQVKYVLPDDAKAVLTIQQCKSIPYVEAFHCQVVAENKIDLSNDTVGTRRITLHNTAMYRLKSDVQVGINDRFDIKWQRN